VNYLKYSKISNMLLISYWLVMSKGIIMLSFSNLLLFFILNLIIEFYVIDKIKISEMRKKTKFTFSSFYNLFFIFYAVIYGIVFWWLIPLWYSIMVLYVFIRRPDIVDEVNNF